MVEGIESAPDTQAKLDIAVVSGKGMAADGVQDARQWESACRNKLEKNGLAIEAATKDATLRRHEDPPISRSNGKAIPDTRIGRFQPILYSSGPQNKALFWLSFETLDIIGFVTLSDLFHQYFREAWRQILILANYFFVSTNKICILWISFFWAALTDCLNLSSVIRGEPQATKCAPRFYPG